MIRQEFSNSKYKDVYHVTTLMIRLGVNAMPSKSTMLSFLEDSESRQILNPHVTRDQVNILRMALRNQRDEVVMSSPKKTEVKSLKKQDEDHADDEQCTLEIEDADDLDTLWHMASLQSQNSQLKEQEENEAHILQRLKESASNLKADQLFAVIKYHVKRQEVISMQREAADIIRRSVDSEYHEHFDVPHNHSSANDVLGSMYLKALMDKYYDLRPGASTTKYKIVQELISDFGKGEKDRYFDVQKWSQDVQQARGAYEMVQDLTSLPREVMRPVQETAIEILQQTARSDPRMVEYSIGKIQEIERSPIDISLEGVMVDVVDRYVRITEAMGHTKGSQQSEKKKGEKPATANPAIKDGMSVQCQICGCKHSASECPEIIGALKQSSIRRGKLLPGETDKDRRRKGNKGESDDETHGEVCLICTKFNLCSPSAARSHTTAECKRVKDNIKSRLLGIDDLSEKEDQT